MSASSPAANAFVALRATIIDMIARDRVTRIAGVKPELQRRLADFDEQQLGYPSFGAFVEAAAREGVVRTVVDDDGWKRLLPVDSSSQLGEGDERLRPDIWSAFTRWGEGWLKCWDRARARALQLPAKPRADEPDDVRLLRSALAANTGSVIEIQPIPMDQQKLWMEEFTADLGAHSLTGPLRAAMQDDRPFRTFSAVLQADPVLRRRYSRFKYARVLEAVREWAAANAVDLDAVDHATAAPQLTSRAETARASATPSVASGDAATLRAALHHAIDDMSAEDLRRVWVPAGYILDAVR
jgi:hypothetical protein